MDLHFEKLGLGHKKLFDNIISVDENHISWNYSFNMMYIWDAFDNSQVCDLGDIVLAYNDFMGITVFFPPYVKNPSLMPQAIKYIDEYCTQIGVPMLIEGICARDADFIDKEKYDVSTNMNDSDYLYNSYDLIKLEGKKFHSKRNFITRFTAKYDYEFVDYIDADFDGVIALYDRWYKKSVHEVLDLEKIVITRALKNHKELGIKIGLLKSKGNIIAFSACGKENELVGHVFFEKGDISYEGIYQIINKLCAEKFLSDCKYINRQEDMGIEGLRKSKLSYNPIIVFDKFCVRRKQ